MMEHADRSPHISSQLSDESSPPHLGGEMLLFECFFSSAAAAAAGDGI